MASRDRLAYLDFGRSPSARPTGSPKPPPSLAKKEHPSWLARFEMSLGGQLEESAQGYRLISRRAHPLDELYGSARLGGVLDLSPQTLVSLGLDPRLGRVDLRKLAFVDCETTGLAGGTGTKAFLVGIAWFGDQGLTVEQHFLPDYDLEPSFLDGISSRLAQAEAIVSFNGKCFDLPLLETRFTLARLPADWLELPHLDALHPARRLWKRRLTSCSLASLEVAILGVRREADLPGWLIPPVYFQYLRTGNFSPLEAVFEHNRRDLLSLAALTSHLGRLLEGGEESAEALDLFSLGRYLEDLGEVTRGASTYRQALSLGLPRSVQAEARRRLALLLRRCGKGEEAVAEWEALSHLDQADSLFALTELAKHHEHRTRDYRLAIEATRRALFLAQLGSDVAYGQAALEALEQRLARLEQRVSGTWRRKQHGR